MIRYPSASNAMDTEVRMLRSSSTSAMIGISPLFRLVGGEVRPRVPLLQRAKQDRNETAGRRMQGLTISNWPRLDEALASNSMNSRHLTCEKARQQQEAQQRSTLSLQDEPRRLLTRFDTGHLFPAGWSNSIPALPVTARSFRPRIRDIPSWTWETN